MLVQHGELLQRHGLCSNVDGLRNIRIDLLDAAEAAHRTDVCKGGFVLCNIKRAADEQRSLIGCHDKCAILHGAGEVVHVERVVEQKHRPRRVLLGHGTAQTVEPRVQFGGGHGNMGHG